MPPVRDRREDVPELLEFFIAHYSQRHSLPVPQLAPEALSHLVGYNWPGNVRELKNVIDRARILARSEEIGPSHIIIDRPDAEVAPAAPAAAGAEDFSLESAEREFIVRALREANWQRTRAAGLLGITRATLHAKIKRYEIRQPEIRGGLAHS